MTADREQLLAEFAAGVVAWRKQAWQYVLKWDLLAWKIARVWFRRCRGRVPLDDIRAAVLMGFFRALVKYRPAAGASFPTYAQHWARHFARDLCRRETARGVTHPEHHGFVKVKISSIHNRLPGGDVYADLMACPKSGEPGRDRFDALTAGLPPAYREAVEMRFRRGMKLQAIGDHFGVSKEAARQRIERALDVIRKRNQPAVA